MWRLAMRSARAELASAMASSSPHTSPSPAPGKRSRMRLLSVPTVSITLAASRIRLVRSRTNDVLPRRLRFHYVAPKSKHSDCHPSTPQGLLTPRPWQSRDSLAAAYGVGATLLRIRAEAVRLELGEARSICPA